MPRTQEQFKGIREERKALIMRVAMELFASGGFHATTIGSIAKEAGISKGLIYNYFDSKEDLIRAIIYSGLEKIDSLMDPDKDGMLTGDEMEYLLNRFFDFLHEDTSFWRLYFTLFMQEPITRLVIGRLTETLTNSINLLTTYFQSRAYEDPYTEALLFGAMLDGIGMNYVIKPEFFPVEKIKKRILKKYR